jgi:hypothetical protein
MTFIQQEMVPTPNCINPTLSSTLDGCVFLVVRAKRDGQYCCSFMGKESGSDYRFPSRVCLIINKLLHMD